MKREQKLLNEIITSLISSLNVVESFRGPLLSIDQVNFKKAQEHLMAAVQYMKRGKHSIDTHMSTEKNRGL